MDTKAPQPALSSDKLVEKFEQDKTLDKLVSRYMYVSVPVGCEFFFKCLKPLEPSCCMDLHIPALCNTPFGMSWCVKVIVLVLF